MVRENWFFWFLQPAHFLVIGLVVLLCYALAHYLTAPLRRFVPRSTGWGVAI